MFVFNLMYFYQNHIISVREIGFSPMQVVQIYFDTATFDEIEKDVKVIVNTVIKRLKLRHKGDDGGSSWLGWGHNGSSHWLLHPQWGRDILLPPKVVIQLFISDL